MSGLDSFGVLGVVCLADVAQMLAVAILMRRDSSSVKCGEFVANDFDEVLEHVLRYIRSTALYEI